MAFLERGGRSLTLFDGAADDPRWIVAMARLVATKRVKKIEVAKIDSLPPADAAGAANSCGVGSPPSIRSEWRSASGTVSPTSRTR